MSNLVNHAEEELAAINMGANSDAENKAMHDDIMAIVRLFGEQGHSGFSANYAINIITKLLRFQPLTPLTGEDSEWVDVTSMMDRPLWQNKRCFQIFKEADGSCYDVEGRVFIDEKGHSYTKQPDSRVAVTFPYTPKVEYVHVKPSTKDDKIKQGEA